MNDGPVRGKNSGRAHPFAEPVSPLMMCECVQTFNMAKEMPCRAVRAGV